MSTNEATEASEDEPQTIESLLAEKVEIEEDIARIKTEIGERNAKRMAGGNKSKVDHAWYAQKKAELRELGIDHQSVIRDVADLRRGQLDPDRLIKSTLALCFLEAANEILELGEYQKIVIRARELREAHGLRDEARI